MIIIDNKLIGDEIIEAQFVCDLTSCKGGCCVDGDAGAPLKDSELKEIENVYEAVKPYLPSSHINEIEQQGLYVYNEEFGWVTPAINGGICVYAITDNAGIVKCGIEQAYYDKKVSWKKPISCHLFPIRVKHSSNNENIYLNYEPREDLCSAACSLGEKLKIPVYKFLKEPLIREYGEEFYEVLDEIAQDYFELGD